MSQNSKRFSAIVASGRALDLDDQNTMERYKKRSASDWWHDRAFMYDEELPGLGYAHDFVRDSLSRVKPIPAILDDDDPDAPPIPLTKETAPKGAGDGFVDLCHNLLRRLEPWPEFMGRSARLLDVPGECHAAIIPDEDDMDGESCHVLSPAEYKVMNGKWVILDSDGDQNGKSVPEGATVWRMWVPSARYKEQPTSPMRRLLGVCKTLLTLEQGLQGVATSRLALNKMLYLPSELTLEMPTADGQAPTDDAGDGETAADTFVDDFIDMAALNIQNPELASAIIPLIVRGPADMADKIKEFDLSRPVEETLIKLRDELRGEVASGINLPRELMLGVGETNHWNADQIEEQTWHQHLESRAMVIVAATTAGYYRPALLANNVDPNLVRRCVVWYDPTWFVGTPDIADNWEPLHDKILISDRAARRAGGASEDDAPDEEEIARRLAMQAARNPFAAPVEEPETEPEAEPAAPAETDQQVEVGDDEGLTAAGRPRDVLGLRLVAIERDLRIRLLQAADAELARALERAGIKVRNQSKRLGRTTFAQLEDVQASLIPSTVGKAQVQALGLDDETLLAGALAGFESTYRRLVRRAQLAAARAAAVFTGRDVDEDELDARLEPSRAAGWGILAAGLATLFRDRLYNPNPVVPPLGEFDDATTVPVGLVRASLDRAGGAQVNHDRDAQPATLPARTVGPGGAPGSGGAVTGPDMLDVFKAELGIVDDHYEWVYGDAPRAREFEPHRRLNGVTFASWDDQVLANSESFPPVDFYRPADHDGCMCDFAVVFTQADSAEEAA